MNEVISIEEKYFDRINAIWEENKGLPYTERGFAVPRELKKHSILFIGINPSYKEGNTSSEEEYNPFYELYKPEKIDPYFKKFIEIKDYCKHEWSHWDLLYIRETSQNNILNNCKDANFSNFINHQLQLSREIITCIEPKIIVVCNSKARDYLMAPSINPYAFDMFPDEEIGTYRIHDSSTLNNVPIFFSSMLTGQRALDRGSYQRLQWHIKWLLEKGTL